MDIQEDPNPTQNAVWAKYTLFYDYRTKQVAIRRRSDGAIRSVTREEAKEMLSRDDEFYSYKSMGVGRNQLYTEVIRLMDHEERRDAQQHLQLIQPVKVNKYL